MLGYVSKIKKKTMRKTRRWRSLYQNGRQLSGHAQLTDDYGSAKHAPLSHWISDKKLQRSSMMHRSL